MMLLNMGFRRPMTLTLRLATHGGISGASCGLRPVFSTFSEALVAGPKCQINVPEKWGCQRNSDDIVGTHITSLHHITNKDLPF